MSDDETYEIPLQDQRGFGAGIKRNRVKFVPSSAPLSSTPSSSNGQTVSNLYLQMVLPGDHEPPSSLPAGSPNVTGGTPLISAKENQVCEICRLPLSEEGMPAPAEATETIELIRKQRPHEASLAHQVCLTHSHPPSHLDRNRKGLAYLSAYGWDPDARRGLGAEGQGIHFPIKAKPKDDKMGIGVVLPKEADRRKKEKVQKLDAKKVRKIYEQDKKKAERLREMFYRNDDVERYLGGG
ncbi:related to G-patch domain protein [Rhynchosporium graminicola]|uniref:Related to G-patch domain protein n=2 Tax=Rhynchosporium TaxID=38037 RepID=A0A1E1MR48_RHYSE|nr:related to G-patch domain protein [Rhynchosporium commune]CZT51567.1 related to G-patch domain protein [Rhynchosporium secalis]